MSKKALVVISFGSTFADTRVHDIGGIEQALATAFPAYDQFRAFTSNIIRKRLNERGLCIDDTTTVLEKLKEQGYEEVILQPTHLLHGEEFEQKILALKEQYQASFKKIIISKPLIVDEQDYKLVATALLAQLPECGPEEGIVFMGHGTPRDNNKAHGYTYMKLQEIFNSLNAPVVIGTVEDEDQPNFDTVLEEVCKRNYKKVHMYPLMVVAGDHANNDMYGDDEDSWKNQLETKGIVTEGHLNGIGRYKAIQALYIQHVLQAMQ